MELLMPFHASLLACWYLWLCNIHHSVQIQISILCAMHCQHWNIHVPPSPGGIIRVWRGGLVTRLRLRRSLDLCQSIFL